MKNLPASAGAAAGNLGPVPGLGRPLGGVDGNPLQCSCLDNPIDTGASQATVPGATESDKTERLSM